MIDWGLLLAALIAVESGGDCNAIGDNGKAVGCLQIHPIMVDDCNRILDIKGKGQQKVARPFRFKKSDREFDSVSRNMAVTYLRWYGDRQWHKNIGMGKYEFYARIWNGGPDGWSEEATVKYWGKVKAAMEIIRKNKQTTKEQGQ